MFMLLHQHVRWNQGKQNATHEKSRHFGAFRPTFSTHLGAQKLTSLIRISKFHHYANCTQRRQKQT